MWYNISTIITRNNNMKKSKPVRNNYVDNKEFSKAMEDYINACNMAEAQNMPIPRVSEYIGECLLKIAENTAKRPNFYNYPFKDQMVSDAVINCLLYIRNYSPQYKNAFSYFTTYTFRAFLRRIAAEKKYFYSKCKLFMDVAPNITDEEIENLEMTTEQYNVLYDNLNDFVNEFEEKEKEKKKIKKAKNLELFIE
jgi:hypothetical protein